MKPLSFEGFVEWERKTILGQSLLDLSDQVRNLPFHRLGMEQVNSEYLESVNVHLLPCDRCGCNMLAVFDGMLAYEHLGHGYLGCQIAAGRYRYSPVVKALAMHVDKRGALAERFNLGKGNLALNSHTAVHVEKGHPFDFSVRCMDGVYFKLCNRCFRKTYSRILVIGEMEGDVDPQSNKPNQRMYALSASLDENADGHQEAMQLPSVNAVAKAAGIKLVSIVGKGSIQNY